MELIIYIFLFLFQIRLWWLWAYPRYSFLGVIFNLKITNYKKVKEIRSKAKDYSRKNN